MEHDPKKICCTKCAYEKLLLDKAIPMCSNVSCPCHTETTPNEEWELAFKKVYYEGFDNFTWIDVQYERVKDFIRETRTAAYEEGKNSHEPQTFSMKKLQQEAYDKGVRDSLEVVKENAMASHTGGLINDECSCCGTTIEEIREAISTLLK